MKFPTKQTLRKSGILFSIFFGIFFGILPYIFYSKIRLIVVFISLIIIFISFISPYLLRYPFLIWIKLGELLGRINSYLILIFFFYIFVTPVSIIKGLFSLIKKFFNRKSTSYYKRDNMTYKVNFEDQF